MRRVFRWLAWIVASAATAAACAQTAQFFGPLRARDLSPFGYLRLDMRPTYARDLAPGEWAIAAELAYQNTWALSPNVEAYLTALPGRRELGPAEVAAIRALPGENYLVDMELAQLDITVRRQLTEHLSAYAIVSGAHYGGGLLDSGIERFHETFGFSTFGRKAVARNDVNIILDLKSMQSTQLEAPTRGGLLDPTLGLRYTGVALREPWSLVLEGAVKLPLSGRRMLLSTGRADVGAQGTLQRLGAWQAFYINAAAVYYAGTGGLVRSGSQIVPTLVLGYERRLTARTTVILQGYASTSPYSHADTDLRELLATKFQLSGGLRQRRGRHMFTFAITENLQNLNNTPDIGFQIGWALLPAEPPAAASLDQQR